MELDKELDSAVQQFLGITHRDGVPWHKAPLPSWFHRCIPHTKSFLMNRCPCGGVQFGPYRPWVKRNSRRPKSWLHFFFL